MTLYYYIARKFVFSVVRIQIAMFAILLLVVTNDVIRFLSERGVDAKVYIQLISVTIPEYLSDIFPLVVLLGSMFTFLGLSRSSELVIVRASGISALKMLLAPTIVTILIGLVTIAAWNPILAATIRKTSDIRAEYTGTGGSQMSISREGLWLRQTGENNNFIIQARNSSRSGEVLYGVRFHEFATDGDLVRRIEATRAELQPGAWKLFNATQWRFLDKNLFETADIRPYPEIVLATDLTSERILSSFAAPKTISVWNLPAFIDQLNASGFSAMRHEVFLQSQYATPLMLVAMMLIGAAFSLKHVRFGNVGVMALLAVLSGFLLYTVKNVAESLGQAQEVPVLLATWAPPLAAALFALAFVLHLEDG
ncbi:LPS export ABC transporter permease LptG [Rhodobacterales bacterium 52_120_T64]|nr:LPS export ABC transporter permease LptG [Rhodobacterales bacterium 52_120_T64]